MYYKLHKGIFLGVLLVLCMSVAAATDVAEDTASDVVTTQSVDIVDTYEKTISTYNSIEEKEKSQTRSIPGDPYTFANETLDITGNNYDGSTLTLLDNVNVISSNNMQLTGTSFVVSGNNVNITGLKMVNNNLNTVAITVTGNNVNLNGNNITVTKTEEGKTMGIVINNTHDVNVENCNIAINAVSQDLYPAPSYEYSLKTSAIVVDNSYDVLLNRNNITLTVSTNTGSTSGTGEAITIRNNSYNVNVYNNTITAENFPYLYGISTSAFSHDLSIIDNTIALTGINHICGIQLSSTSDSTVRRNHISGNCSATSGTTASSEAFAYGIALSSSYKPEASESTYNIIDSNNVTLTSTVAYAYELSNADYTQLINNNGTVTGNVVMGLGIYNSSYCNISGNRFIVSGNTSELSPYIYEAIYPVTTGIKINETSSYNNITDNYIEVTEQNEDMEAYAIFLYGTSNTDIEYNQLFADYDGNGSVYGKSGTDIVDHNNE